jgi:hypothetical protein
LKRKGAALVQRRDAWYGLSFTVHEQRITDLEVHMEKDLIELRSVLKEDGYGVALEDVSAYLFNLSFPFSDKNKIRLVIGNELEERLPVSAEDMTIDFVPGGNGSVLAAAVQNSLVEEFKADKRVKVTTLQSLAVLHALKWFNVIHQKDYVFLHINGSTVVLMAFKGERLYSLRQFFHAPGSPALEDAVREIVNDKAFVPRSFIMISDDADAETCRQKLEKMFAIEIQIPRLARLVDGDVPEWLWPGIGAGLISVRPKGAINFTGARHGLLFMSSKSALRLSAGLACLGLIAFGVFSLDYFLKERVYQYLSAEPGRLYKQAFPKSPPVRDPARMFREKLRVLEREPGVVAAGSNPLAILNEISAKIPAGLDVRINEFTADEKEFTLSGTTVSFATVEKLKAAMEQIGGVSQIEMQNVELAQNRQVKFKVRGKL